MAITIIGAGPSAEKAEDVLPRAEVDLPNPASVPENHRLLDRARLTSLLSHERPLIRTYALEQIARREGEDWEDALIGASADVDPLVSAEAIAILGQRKSTKAIEPIAKRFETGSGELAAVAASALGQIAPERLLEVMKLRGRLDDEAYAATATSIAIIPSPEVIEFLSKALNRAGALSPERRGTLYGAALLSGNVELSARVIGLAITDSQEEEPEGSAFPTRAALGGIAGVPMQLTARPAGLELFDQSREILEKIVLPLLGEEDRKNLEQALKLKRAGEVLSGLEPVLSMAAAPAETDEEKQDVVEELGTMPERRRGLLRALIARADAIGKLELNSAALFVAAAVKASVVIAAGGDEASSEAVTSLAKALEGEVSSERLAHMRTDELTEIFRAKSPRAMRRVLAVLTRESFRRSRTLLRFAKASILGGHAKELLETMSDVEEVGIQNPILDAFAACPVASEAAVVDVFAERPLNEKVLPYALAVAEELRTERIGLAIARRFYELRDHGRAAVARTLMRVADPRAIPLLESRAYPEEAEEVAWTVLSLLEGRPVEGRLEEALTRTMGGRDDGQGLPLRVPLRCRRCNETLTYAFRRAFLDVEAKDQWGDPAFVGEVKCKACGFDEEPFEPTETATQILTSHMIEVLAASRAGRPVDRALVTPAQTTVKGQRMGFARALRTLNQDVAASPGSIRTRLHRARMRLMLERPGAAEDVERVLAEDPNAVEGLTLRASIAMRAQDYVAAAESVLEAIKRLDDPEGPRLYDVEDPGPFRESLEELLVDLRHLGAPIPESISLQAAETRLRMRSQEMEARRAEFEEDRAPRPPARQERRESQSRGAEEDRTQRPLSVRKRQEVQEVPRRAIALLIAAALTACRILPSPPLESAPGTDPIPEHPAGLSVEDVRVFSASGATAATFSLRGAATYDVGEDTFSRRSSYNAWRGTCRLTPAGSACSIEPHRGVQTSTMGLALLPGPRGLRGAWFDAAGTLDLVEGAAGIAVRAGTRTLAEVAFDRRPPSGWIDQRLGGIQRARIAPLLLALAALPDPRALFSNAEVAVGTATPAVSRASMKALLGPDLEELGRGPPEPAYGPDTRFWRAFFFVAELVGVGGSFPIATPLPDEGAPARLSPRAAYSVYTGVDYADFIQLLAGVESRSIAFDAGELAKVSPPGGFEVHGHIRLALTGRVTFFRAGAFASYLGLERVWLVTDTTSILFQTADIDPAAHTGYSVTAQFHGSGWAPLFGLKYRFGPVLHGGDWWSGVSSDVLLEGRYESIEWGVPKIVFQTLGNDPAIADRALGTATAWLNTYPTPRRTHHVGFRLALQVRF